MVSGVEDVLAAYAHAQAMVRDLEERIRDVLDDDEIASFADEIVRVVAARCEADRAEGSSSCESFVHGKGSIVMRRIGSFVDALPLGSMNDLVLPVLRQRLFPSGEGNRLPVGVAVLAECMAQVMLGAAGGSGAEANAGRESSCEIVEEFEREGCVPFLEAAIPRFDGGARAVLISSNDIMWTMREREAEAKKRLIDESCLACVIALPARLLPNSSLGICMLLFDKGRVSRNILMIDARDASVLSDDGVHRTLTEAGIRACVDTLDRWLSGDADYVDTPRYCRSVPPEAVLRKKHLLAPELFVSEAALSTLHDDGSSRACVNALHLLDERIDAAMGELYAALGALGVGGA